jgi:hypothetical protein
MKQQLLESFGFSADERFPVFSDRFPIQLLSYLRLSRIQDPLMFAKVGVWVRVCVWCWWPARHWSRQELCRSQRSRRAVVL